MFLLWGISLPEQKMKPSESSADSSEAGERELPKVSGWKTFEIPDWFRMNP